MTNLCDQYRLITPKLRSAVLCCFRSPVARLSESLSRVGDSGHIISEPPSAFRPKFFRKKLQIVAVSIIVMVLLSIHHAHGQDGPLPKFDVQGIALHPKDLDYAPNEDLIHPTIVKTEGRIKNPLGKYYLYYAPHKHIATSMAYSDSLDGPWTEYKGNPVVEGPSAPEIRWIDEHGKFFLWGHRKNSQTELWTSEDGIHFEYDSVSITILRAPRSFSLRREVPLTRISSMIAWNDSVSFRHGRGRASV